MMREMEEKGGNCLKLCQERLGLDIRENFFREKVVRQCWPRAVVESPSLKSNVDVALGDMSQ